MFRTSFSHLDNPLRSFPGTLQSNAFLQGLPASRGSFPAKCPGAREARVGSSLCRAGGTSRGRLQEPAVSWHHEARLHPKRSHVNTGPPGCLGEEDVLRDSGRPLSLYPHPRDPEIVAAQGATLLVPATPRSLYPQCSRSAPRTEPTESRGAAAGRSGVGGGSQGLGQRHTEGVEASNSLLQMF